MIGLIQPGAILDSQGEVDPAKTNLKHAESRRGENFGHKFCVKGARALDGSNPQTPSTGFGVEDKKSKVCDGIKRNRWGKPSIRRVWPIHSHLPNTLMRVQLL